MKQIILTVIFSISLFAHDAYLKAKWNNSKTAIEIQPIVASYFEKKEVQPIKNHSRLFDIKVVSTSTNEIPNYKISPDSLILCLVETTSPLVSAVRVQPRDITLPRKSATDYFKHELGITGKKLEETLEKGVDSVYEVYERTLKTVVAVNDIVGDKLLGLQNEILIKEVNFKKGTTNITVQLFENGSIVSNGAVRVLTNGKTKLLYTNKNGELTFKADKKEPILFAHIKLVKNSPKNFNTYWTNTSLYFL